jgi:hypothetical protein
MRSKQVSVKREIRTLRSTWRGLETWHGRDAVTPRNRKGEATVNTNIDLNRRASLRPYLGAPGGAIPLGDSTMLSNLPGGAALLPRNGNHQGQSLDR